MAAAALRLGLMVPANNTTMESELLAWLPGGASCRTLRIPRGEGMLGPAEIPAYVARALELARSYDPDQTDIVAYGCTAAGFLGGPARDAGIQRDLAAVTGKPVVTTANAMVEVLRHIGARRVAVVTPYPDQVNERLRAYLEQSGIAVTRLASFRAATTDELAAITPSQISALARDTMTSDSDAMFVACSQLPTLDILDGLAREFDKPVWSSIKATAWHAQRVLAGAMA
ncbi:MAG: aspartate/glutamate racemase family protein [Pseudomonadota bacterium]